MRLRVIMSENMGWKWAPRKGPDWLPLYQIRVEGVRLLSCWVHMWSGLYLPRRVKGHQPSFIAVMATLWESVIAAVWSQKQRGVVTRKGNSLLQAWVGTLSSLVSDGHRFGELFPRCLNDAFDLKTLYDVLVTPWATSARMKSGRSFWLSQCVRRNQQQ